MFVSGSPSDPPQGVVPGTESWPVGGRALEALQGALARAGDAAPDAAWEPASSPLVGGVFIAYAAGEAGPGASGDRAWAAAVCWTAGQGDELAPPGEHGQVLVSAVVSGAVPAPYRRGLLAEREGAILEAAVDGLEIVPDVLLVDAVGRDHPRGAGLALHLGAVVGVPTVGVTHRPLQAEGAPPGARRGAGAALFDPEGCEVARWVRTRTEARPVVAHAAWRTTPSTAAAVVLHASDGAARTPTPLRRARHLARATRAEAGDARAPHPSAEER